MKLHHKINIRFLVITSLIFIPAGFVIYFLLVNALNKNINEMLESRRDYVKLYLKKNILLSSKQVSPDQTLTIEAISPTKKFRIFSDTLIYDHDEKELVLSRKYEFITDVDGKFFKVAIIQSLVESEDLAEIIAWFMVALFATLLITLFFVNRWLSLKAWKPFYNSLYILQSFKIEASSNPNFPNTRIYEFDLLNTTLKTMMDKIQSDFLNLKEFSENASHEIQTPLAIIKSKLEMVLHDKSIPQQHYQRIYAAYESASRLSKLNEGLLLLSKIENRQFIEQEKIDLCSLIIARTESLKELFAIRNIELSTNIDKPFIIVINPVLADILVNNLLGNSLKHNIEKGKIHINTIENGISIQNTGLPPEIEKDKIFRRFVKQTTSGESTGLGLAIVSEICKIYNLQIRYDYIHQLHCISITQPFK